MRCLTVIAVVAGLAAPAQATELGSTQQPIVGGTPTDTDPAVVELITVLGGGRLSLCSGTLIAPRVVLTAAHCVDRDTAPERQLAHFGTTVHGDDPGFIARREVVDSTFFDPWSLSENDIALVLLDEPAPVDPVPIDRLGLSDVDIGQTLRLVGWGDTLGDAGDAGTKRMATATLDGFYNEWVLSYGSADGNTCQGDSGGPILMQRGGREIVVGVTSWGVEGCEGVSGATRVGAYIDWIDAWLTKHGEVLPKAIGRAAGDPCSVVEDDCGDGLDCVGDGTDAEIGQCVAPIEDGNGPGGEAGADGPAAGGCSAGSGGAAGLALLLLGAAVTASRRSRSRGRRCPRP